MRLPTGEQTMTVEDPQNEDHTAINDTHNASAVEEPTLPDAPILNREQRRAQAKGKKGAPPTLHPSNNMGNRGPGARPANASISNKIPRTGHK